MVFGKEAIKMEVGQTFTQIDGPVTRENIKAYAKASGDRNPIHLDEEFAVQVGLKGVIVHGMLYFGYISRMMGDVASKNNAKFINLGGELRGMLRPGDTVVTTAKVTGIVGNQVSFEIIQNSKMPLKIEKDGAVIKTFEAEDKAWVKEKELSGIKTEETDEGTFTFREWLTVKGHAKIELL